MSLLITSQMKLKAEKFVSEWDGNTKKEEAESQTFINEFFQIFDLNRRKIGDFEKSVTGKNRKGTGSADFFWSGKLIIEAKSAHLDKASNWENTLKQAKEYVEDLPLEQRPEYILLMNFKRIQIHKVDKKDNIKISFLNDICRVVFLEG